MYRLKPTVPMHVRRVWRISQSNPMGEWVELVAPVVAKHIPIPIHSQKPSPVPSTELPEVSYGSWVTSSYDLLDGSDVIEDPDTIPGELFDELFGPRQDGPKSPGK